MNPGFKHLSDSQASAPFPHYTFCSISTRGKLKDRKNDSRCHGSDCVAYSNPLSFFPFLTESCFFVVILFWFCLFVFRGSNLLSFRRIFSYLSLERVPST